MSKIELGNILTVLDNIVMHGSFTKACERSGITEMTLWRWRRASEEGDERFQDIEYQDIVQPFHMHVEDCIEQSIDDLESNFRASAKNGYHRAVLHHGKYQYEPDEVAEAMTEDEFKDALDLGIVWPDKKKRVRNPVTGEWERVKITEWIPPSVEAQTVVLRAWTERYMDKRQVKFDGNLSVNQQLGVTVISGAPRVAPPPQQLEVVTPQIADAVNEMATDATFAEIDEQEEPMAAQPFEPNPDSPLSEEQQRIMARARVSPLAADLAAKALNRPKPSATPRPAPGLLPSGDQDDCAPRRPPPGSYKVA